MAEESVKAELRIMKGLNFTMCKQRCQIRICVGLLILVAVIGCSKQSTTVEAPSEQKALPEAKAFNGEVYRTKDRSETITLVSNDELETKKGGVNLICKYTRQAGQLRVVANVMGTSQALYYRIVEDGLQDEKGTIFYKPSRFGAVDELTVSEQTLDQQWAMVCNVYQRRADLIPNLLNTVTVAATFDKSVVNAVTQARSSVGLAQLDPNKAPTNAAQLEQFQQAQWQLSKALSRLLVVAGQYPELKTNQNFLSLQAQLEGTENRISVERAKFNEAVKNYNSALPAVSRRLPFFSGS